jgi:hypothetical protein
MKVRSLEDIFYEFKISCKSERFLRVEKFYGEHTIGKNQVCYDQAYCDSEFSWDANIRA